MNREWRELASVVVGVVALTLMVFFLLIGAVSPEPSDHPDWYVQVVRTSAGMLLANLLAYACVPAYSAASSVVAHWGWGLWSLACCIQFVLYFGLTLCLMEAVAGLCMVLRRVMGGLH